MPHVHTDEMQALRDDVRDIAINTANLVGKFDTHIANNIIHQAPPCEAHKSLCVRLWGLGVSVLVALVGVAYNALKGQ
jgi:hypothetical protein